MFVLCHEEKGFGHVPSISMSILYMLSESGWSPITLTSCFLGTSSPAQLQKEMHVTMGIRLGDR